VEAAVEDKNKRADELIWVIKAILKKYNLRPVGDEEFWNAHEDIQVKSPAEAGRLEELANELMALDGQTTMSAWGHHDKRTLAKVATSLLTKGDSALAQEVLALGIPEPLRDTAADVAFAKIITKAHKEALDSIVEDFIQKKFGSGGPGARQIFSKLTAELEQMVRSWLIEIFNQPEDRL
jgi:hypothetical protein